MAALTLRVLAAALLEGIDLRSARLLDDLADDARASNAGRADVIGRAIEQRQHFVEHNPGAGFAGQSHDGDLILGGNLVLFATGLDDCEHRSFPCSARLATHGACAAGFLAVDRKSGSREPRLVARV